jgi:type IV secretory pathway VirB3-like protein
MVQQQVYRDPIFKGATRPAMVLGVPMVPFVIVAGSHIVLGMWLLILVSPFWFFVLMSACVVEVIFLRLISTHDPHRLNQELLAFTSKYFRRNAATWGTHSMSPLDFKKR